MTAQPNRDGRIDFYRGLCLLGMIVWHLLSYRGTPLWLSFPVIQALNFVAEGFVLLAGLSVGVRESRIGGPVSGPGYYLGRSGSLLLWHYALAIPIAIYLMLTGQEAAQASWSLAAARLWDVAVFHYQPYLGDVLSVFVFLFVLAPICLYGLRRVGWGPVWGLSLLTFVVSNLLFSYARPWLPGWELNRAGAFDVNTWQLVFVSGLWCGQHYQRIAAWANDRGGRVLPVLFLVFIVVGGYRWWVLGHREEAQALVPGMFLFLRHPMTAARLLYVGVQLAIVGIVIFKFWESIRRLSASRHLVYLGAHSLPAFVLSVYLDYLLKGLLEASGLRGGLIVCAALAVELLVIVTVLRTFAQETGRDTHRADSMGIGGVTS